MVEPLKIPIRRIRPDAPDKPPLPHAMSVGAAGMDLHADVDGELTLQPGETAAVPTGLAIAVPEGYEAQVRPRSGLALKHSVGILNSPGTIDSDYRGEVKVILTNFGREPFTIRRSDRIAQLVVAPVSRVNWLLMDELPATERGEGGFGHTGR